MDDTPDTAQTSATDADQNVGQVNGQDVGPAASKRPGLRLPKLPMPAVRLPALKLPALKLPALKLPAVKALLAGRPHWRRPRIGRPSLPDLVLAVGAASLVLSIVYVLTGPARRSLDERTREATVLANAATLQLAAETFAAGNLGRYPADVLELLPYLPAGDAPLNPFTGDKTLFRGVAGDLTYRSATGGGYVIEAWGPGVARPRRLGSLKSQAPAVSH